MYENPEWYWDIEQEVSDQILYWMENVSKKENGRDMNCSGQWEMLVDHYLNLEIYAYLSKLFIHTNCRGQFDMLVDHYMNLNSSTMVPTGSYLMQRSPNYFQQLKRKNNKI